MGIALHGYAAMHPRKLAFGPVSPQLLAGTMPNPAVKPNQKLSWLVEILPFVEEDQLYRQFDFSAGWEAPANLPFSQTSVRLFECPGWKGRFSSAQAFETPYIGIVGLGAEAATRPLIASNIGAFGYDRQVAISDVQDG